MSKQTNIFNVINDNERGYCCEYCGSFVKKYTRSFNCNMALLLVYLVRHKEYGFVHVESFLSKHKYKRCGDFSYLVHYGFLRKLEGKREDGSNRNGYYQITGNGIMFAENKITAKEKFVIFRGKLEDFKGGDIGVVKALGNKFNYENLMLGI